MRLLLPYWPAACVLQFVLCAQQEASAERSICRAVVAIATTLNLLFSDRFHNGDERHSVLPAEQRKSLEVFWLRWDFIGISLVLSATFVLWASHFAWSTPLDTLSWASAFATAQVAVAAFTLFERGRSVSDLGEILIKATMGVQFVGFFGYMVYSALGTECGPYTVIWFVYGVGFVSYVSQWPPNGPALGAHDVFHVFVLLGHVTSMVCDVVNVTSRRCSLSP